MEYALSEDVCYSYSMGWEIWVNQENYGRLHNDGTGLFGLFLAGQKKERKKFIRTPLAPQLHEETRSSINLIEDIK